MQILIVDKHKIKDNRIQRHIYHLLKYKYKVKRINFNNELEEGQSELYSADGVLTLEAGLKYPSNIVGVKLLFKKVLTYFFPAIDPMVVINKLEIDQKQTTIIHVHDPDLIPFANFLSNRVHNSYLIYDRHEVWEFSNKKKLTGYRMIEILYRKKIDGVITVLDVYKSQVKRLFNGLETVVIPNYPILSDFDDAAIQTKIQNINSETIINFIYFGDLNRDIDAILTIADKLMDERSDVQFFIGGPTTDSGLLNSFMRMSEKHGQRFKFLHWLDKEDVFKYTQEAHFGFFMIKKEMPWFPSSPNKLFEYLRCGTIPIVRAACSNKNELLPISLWFEKDDSDELVFQNIIRLLSDKPKIAEFSQKGYELGKKFSFESIEHRYSQLYDNVTHPPKK